jgi:hypothetical protein
MQFGGSVVLPHWFKIGKALFADTAANSHPF